jgi:hypothetical protein
MTAPFVFLFGIIEMSYLILHLQTLLDQEQGIHSKWKNKNA